MHRAWIVTVALATACGGWQSGPCDAMCRELADHCDYAAYPSFSSCYEGCVYEQSERGADITAQNECVQAAECDTFAIVECEHANGAQ